MLFHVETNVSPWRNPRLAQLDAVLAQTSTPLQITWTDLEYVDHEHFTPGGLHEFARRLARQLDRHLPHHTPVTLVTDSTVDHLNRDETDAWTGEGERIVREEFGARPVRVDAVRGSGFVAPPHFLPRMRGDVVVLCGGWNDVDDPRLVDVARYTLRRYAARRRGETST